MRNFKLLLRGSYFPAFVIIILFCVGYDLFCVSGCLLGSKIIIKLVHNSTVCILAYVWKFFAP